MIQAKINKGFGVFFFSLPSFNPDLFIHLFWYWQNQIFVEKVQNRGWDKQQWQFWLCLQRLFHHSLTNNMCVELMCISLVYLTI